MKVRIKHFNGELPSYLTLDKVYDFDTEYCEIETDDGFNLLIILDDCEHLNGGSWEIIEE